MRFLPKKQVLVLVILVAVSLNVITFLIAYPQTFTPEFPYLSRDFSAYYLGEWRLLHNPAEIYHPGPLPGDYQIPPYPQTFKYAPSFLLLFMPILTLSYQHALDAFDIMQVALIPVLAFFVYKLVKDKNLALASAVAVIVLIAPLPSLQLEPGGGTSLSSHWILFSSQTVSQSYNMAYTLANAHVLQTVLLVGALYFGYTKKPWLSALLLTLGSFDPRAAILALPLLLWYNRQSIAKFLAGAVTFLAALNLPFFFYYGIGFSFLKSEMSGYVVSQFYQYDWIPLYSIAALTIAELITVTRTQMINRRPLQT